VDLDMLLHAAHHRGFQMIESDSLVGDLAQRNDRVLVVIAVYRQRGAGADFTRTLRGEQHELKSVRDFDNTIFNSDARHFSRLFRNCELTNIWSVPATGNRRAAPVLDQARSTRLYAAMRAGRMAEWLCRGLQILV